jgi:hypothetical protein
LAVVCTIAHPGRLSLRRSTPIYVFALEQSPLAFASILAI